MMKQILKLVGQADIIKPINPLVKIYQDINVALLMVIAPLQMNQISLIQK